MSILLTGAGASYLPPTPFGLLFSDDYQRASLGSNYTASGVTASIVANKLVTSSGGGSFSNTVAYSGYGQTNLSEWTQIVNHIAPSTAALSFLGVGCLSKTINGGTSCQCGLLIFAGGAGCLARIYINGILLASSGSSISVSTGDLLTTTLNFDGATYNLTINNITKATSVSVSATANTTVVGSIQGQSWFSLFPYAGIATVTSWVTSTNENKYSDYCFIGDSITQVFCCTNINNCYSYLVGNDKNKVVLKLAGVNNVTQDIINALPEIIAFMPRKAFIMIGGNDIYFGVSSATWQANINTIKASLIAAGIQVIWLYNVPRTPTNITAVNTYLAGLGVTTIDTYTPLWSGSGTSANPTMYNADLVHPNDFGNQTLANTITPLI